MSQHFAFPPPPPPPPKRDQQVSENVQTYSQPYRGRGRGRGTFRGTGSHIDGNHRGRGRPNGGSSNFRYNHNSKQAISSNASNYDSRSNQDRPGSSGSPASPSTKRDHHTAFGARSNTVSRPKAPPAVPSFNVDIDSLLSKKTQGQAKPVIKAGPARKNNILGLTPSTQLSDPESETDDDEARLAQTSATDGFTFSHNGQTLSLRTPEEIAAWIAERKRKYPTNAKIEAAQKAAEAKKQIWEKQKKEREEAARIRREERNKQRHDHEKHKIKERMLAQVTAQAKAALGAKREDESPRMMTKAEKLRRKVERATRQLKEAEDALRRTQAEEDAAQIQPADIRANISRETGTESAENAHHHENPLNTKPAEEAIDAMEEAEPDSSSGAESEDTSTSGSSDENDSDSDSAPEEVSSKRDGPVRVPPPQNDRTAVEQRICHNFAKFGKCKYGRKCHYSHKLPKRDKDPQKKDQPLDGRRKGLYQLMVEKEQEEQRKQALRAIIALGEKGLLKADASE